jgi:tetraacyldisaccharide 4'-kinase
VSVLLAVGYGGTQGDTPYLISKDDDPRAVGDEPLLLTRATDCPVVIARNRLEAAKFLSAQRIVDVILSDDGMQHYALPRNVEIAVLGRTEKLGEWSVITSRAVARVTFSATVCQFCGAK